jgi:hypothetical protein
MRLGKRIFPIPVVGPFFLAVELLVVSVPNHEMARLAHELGRTIQSAGNARDVAAALPKSARSFPTPQGFLWNWRDSQELEAREALRTAKITNHEKRAIAAAIAAELLPIMSDLEIESESQLRKAAMDTRIKTIDLNSDGVPEVVAQGMVNCSPTGNCPFWVFQKTNHSYKLLLESYGQTFTIQKRRTNGYRDIVVSMQGSATESGLTDYRYKDGSYHEVGCYDAEWTAIEGDTIRELKEPKITPCGYR